MSEVLFEVKDVDVESTLEQVVSLSIEDKAKLYRAIKAKRSQISSYTDKLKKIEDGLANLMQEFLESQGFRNVSVEGVGRIQMRTDTKTNVADDETFYKFILERINEAMDNYGSPIPGFSFLGKTPSKQVREYLEEQAKESLLENPYGAGSLEAGLPYEEQVLARMEEEAAKIGIKVYQDTKTSVVKN